MAYFADLSEYTYSVIRPERPAVVLNVGWLAADRPYSTGECPPGFVARLRELARASEAVMRGLHFCELCPGPDDQPRKPCGTGEIRVRGAGPVVYAAPVLAVHYVAVHGYRPPDEFIAAVLGSA